ncbi:MAG TPA: hypothetical protein PLB89_04830 [Flavobacteriales bacterium]|nr:hypothetical protein [Flavobacteriales bacterium]
MATQKQYIGSGKATQYDGVSVSIRMEDAEKFLRTNDSGTWLNFIVSPRKEPKEGRTHKVFVIVDAPTEQPAAPAMASEPAGTPVGEVIEEGGKKLRKISKAEAAKLKAAKA